MSKVKCNCCGDEEIYKHLYAIWSADEMENPEFQFHVRQVLDLCARHRKAAVDELLDELEREIDDGTPDIDKLAALFTTILAKQKGLYYLRACNDFKEFGETYAYDKANKILAQLQPHKEDV